jgi:general stress protein YciG
MLYGDGSSSLSLILTIMANDANTMNTNRRSGRGFAGMDRDRQREIASEGGKAAHASGHAHEWSSEEAREAGRKGGQARSRNQNQDGNDLGDDLIR